VSHFWVASMKSV